MHPFLTDILYFLEYKPALNKRRSWLDAAVNRVPNAINTKSQINAGVWQNGMGLVPNAYPRTSHHVVP